MHSVAERTIVRVEGRVQGVGFRWFTREAALQAGVTGTVRNLPDGAVEAVAEGTPDELRRWLSQVRQGPPMSRVLNCAVTQADATGEFDRFDIR